MKAIIERKYEVYSCFHGGMGFSTDRTLEKVFDTRKEAEKYALDLKNDRRFIGYTEIKERDVILEKIEDKKGE